MVQGYPTTHFVVLAGSFALEFVEISLASRLRLYIDSCLTGFPELALYPCSMGRLDTSVFCFTITFLLTRLEAVYTLYFFAGERVVLKYPR